MTPLGSEIELLLFSTDPAFVGAAASAGVDGIVVDWERSGKVQRQTGADTAISTDTPGDLRVVRGAMQGLVVCRLDNRSGSPREELGLAVSLGADEVLLPMVSTVDEVEQALEWSSGRCGVGILVETEAAVEASDRLSKLPLSRVFVGLNDLTIERGSPCLFEPLLDGTVEAVRRSFTCPFGFGGLTRPDRGYPVPSRLLIAEMARLGCSFSFLRRSFLADVRIGDLQRQIPRIRSAYAEAGARTGVQIGQDQADLKDAITVLLGAVGAGIR